jgi:hypothetical protein
MIRVDIGIHLHGEPEWLGATLAHLRAATTKAPNILPLPDGPDAATRQMLETYGNLQQFPTDQPLGAAVCFNRLLRHSDAELVIFERFPCRALHCRQSAHSSSDG